MAASKRVNAGEAAPCVLQLLEKKTLMVKHNEFIFLINTTKQYDMLISYRQEWTFHITVAETYSQWLPLLLHNLHDCTFNEYIWQLKDNINHLL